MAKIIYTDRKNLEELLKDGTLLLVFYAPWCKPCKMLTPELEKIAEDNESIKVIKVNVDENIALTKDYGVKSIPTILLIKEGTVTKNRQGYATKEALIEFIKSE